ncbi:hypothetical protein [Eudoraea adriatica]|uniref:hypothetical protein n=1 Tax=Eudoraea adriatica TaxID=446681 RepID=UPI00037A1C44|nr:hypothetical protein [Eudoraea adriatica]
MRSKLLLIAGIFVFITACQNQKKENLKSSESVPEENHFDFPDSLSARRISFVLNLKQAVAKNTWPDFGKKSTEGTLIYFNTNKSEVFFPDSLVIKTLVAFDKYSDDYLSASRTDSIPYHMENMLSFDPADSTHFYYDNPVEQYSSVEEIGNYIPSVESSEMWSTMVIHEMFHHYQFNNVNYKEYARNEINPLSFNPNNLYSLCKEDENFLTMIQKENDHLMKAISDNNGSGRDSLISTYLEKRKNRIEKYSMEYPDLEKVEDFYVIQEGSARYIEYKSMFILSDYANSSDSIVILNDPMFKSYVEFKEVDLTKQAFSYLTYAAPSDYHYTIGFNIMRLLDVLRIDYKPYLLNKPQNGLHKYLEDYINTLPNNSYVQY